MNARSRIWEELKQAKVNIICIQEYTDKKRRYNRYFTAFVAISASMGVVINPLVDNFAFYTSIAIGLISIIKSIMPNFLQQEEELLELDGLHSFYSQYMNTLEKIWYEFDHQIRDERDTMEMFFKQKNTECDKGAILNKGIRNIPTRFQKRIDQKASEYINRVYFTKSENQ